MQSTKFSREVFYKKCFLLLSTYQGVCAICLSWHQAGEEEEGEKRSGTILWYAAKGQEFMAVN